MHALKFILISAFLWTAFICNTSTSNAQDAATRFNVNTDATAFPATSFGRPNYASVRYSPKGTYIFLQSDHQVQVFESSSGRIVYQSNGGKDVPGFNWTPAYKSIDYETNDIMLLFTPDEKYLRLHVIMKGRSGNLYFYQYIDLIAGMAVPEGALYNQLRKSVGDDPEFKARVARNSFLKVKRPYSDKNRPEATSWLWEMPDPEDSTRILALFQQDYLGTKEWRKSIHPEWDKARFKREEESLFKGSSRLEYGDFHYASLGKVPGDMVYKGTWRKGMTGIELRKVKEVVAVTPDGKYAVMIVDTRNLSYQVLECVEIKTGKVMWTRPDGEYASLINMNAFNNLFVSRMDHNTKTGFASLIDIRTGDFIINKEIPYIFFKEQVALSPDNGTMALIHFDRTIKNIPEGAIALTIHDINTGKILLTLSDEASFLAYANRLKKDYVDRAQDIEKANAEYQVYRKQQLEIERKYWLEREKKDEAEYKDYMAKHKDDCTTCNGSGRIEVRSSYVTKRVVSDGGTYKVVESVRVYSPFNVNDWKPCSRCNGRGKIK